jgi:hypothetical protein
MEAVSSRERLGWLRASTYGWCFCGIFGGYGMNEDFIVSF